LYSYYFVSFFSSYSSSVDKPTNNGVEAIPIPTQFLFWVSRRLKFQPQSAATHRMIKLKELKHYSIGQGKFEKLNFPWFPRLEASVATCRTMVMGFFTPVLKFAVQPLDLVFIFMNALRQCLNNTLQKLYIARHGHASPPIAKDSTQGQYLTPAKLKNNLFFEGDEVEYCAMWITRPQDVSGLSASGCLASSVTGHMKSLTTAGRSVSVSKVAVLVSGSGRISEQIVH
jgi:hypothetical protein